MLYKNSIKILLSNFNIVWKSMLYYFLVFAVNIFLIILCINPVYKLLLNSGFINNCIDVYGDFLTSLNLTELFSSISNLFNAFCDIIVNNISSYWFYFLSLAVIVFFLKTILCNLTIMVSSNSLHYYMSSLNKHGFFTSFSETWGKSLKVQVIYVFLALPVKLFQLVLFILTLKLFNIYFWLSVLAIILIIFEFVLFTALKYVLFAGWIPTIVVMNYSPMKALKVSLKNTFRIFPRALSNAIGIVITIIIINVLMGPFTLMVGFLLSIPISYMLYSTFGMVLLYECQGMRYYVDIYNVISPQKRERSDKFKKMKFVV